MDGFIMENPTRMDDFGNPYIKVLSLTLIPQLCVTKLDLLTKVLVDYCMWSLAVLHNLDLSGDSFISLLFRMTWEQSGRLLY